VWRQAENHRCDRRARGDRAHPHTLGVVGAAATSLAGAAAGVHPCGLSREAQPRFSTRADDPARPAVARRTQIASKSCNSGRCRFQKIVERPKFSPNTVRLTDRSVGDTVAVGAKGGLNFLYGGLSFRIGETSASARLLPATASIPYSTMGQGIICLNCAPAPSKSKTDSLQATGDPDERFSQGGARETRRQLHDVV
jgi:hypothetical protein